MKSSPGTGLKAASVAVLAAVLGLAASGCGGGSGTQSSAATGSSPTAGSSLAATHAAPTPSQTILTGTTLNALLRPASTMPAGFRLDSQGARNSGPSVTPDSSAPVPASKVCDLLTGTSWVLTAGIDSATFAQNDYVDAAKTQEIAQEIDTFYGTDATKVMSALWRAFGRCRSFTRESNGMTARTSLVRSRLSGMAGPAIKAVMTSPAFYGGTTLVAIRIGDAVVTFLDSSSHSDEGAAAVTMAEHIAAQVKRAQNRS